MLAPLPASGALQIILPAVWAEMPDRTLLCRSAVAGTFMATLDFARGGNLPLEPDAAFGPIAALGAAASAADRSYPNGGRPLTLHRVGVRRPEPSAVSGLTGAGVLSAITPAGWWSSTIMATILLPRVVKRDALPGMPIDSRQGTT